MSNLSTSNVSDSRGVLTREPPPPLRSSFNEHLVPERTTNTRNSMQNSIMMAQLAPLRRENARFLRSNNNLHAQLMTKTEMLEQKEIEWNDKSRRQQSAFKDLQFLASQKTRQVNSQEALINDLQKRLSDVLQRNAIFSKQALETSKRQQDSVIPENKTFVAQAHIDALQTSERKRELLERELGKSQVKEQAWNLQEQKLAQALGARDQEIARLHKVVEGERNWSKLVADNELDEKNQLITKLEGQLDFVNAENTQMSLDLKSFEEHGATHAHLEILQRKNEEITILEEKYQQTLNRADSLDNDIKAHAAEATYFKEQYNSEHVTYLERTENLEKLLATVTDEKNQALTEIESKNHSIETLQQQLRVRTESTPTADHFAVWESKVVNLEAHLKECRTVMDNALKKEEAARSELSLTAQTLASERRQATEHVNQLTDELKSTLDTNTALMAKIDALTCGQSEMQEELSVLTQRLESQNTQKVSGDSELTWLTKQNQKLAGDLKTSKDVLFQKEAEQKRLEKDIARVQIELNAVSHERVSLAGELTLQANKTKEVHAKYVAEEAEVARLKEMLNSMENVAGEVLLSLSLSFYMSLIAKMLNILVHHDLNMFKCLSYLSLTLSLCIYFVLL